MVWQATLIYHHYSIDLQKKTWIPPEFFLGLYEIWWQVKIKNWYSIFQKTNSKINNIFMMRKDWSLCDQILQTVAVLDKKLTIFIFLFSTFFLSFFLKYFALWYSTRPWLIYYFIIYCLSNNQFIILFKYLNTYSDSKN